MNDIDKNGNYTNQSFEDIKHIDENGIEYWYAREFKLENKKLVKKNIVN